MTIDNIIKSVDSNMPKLIGNYVAEELERIKKLLITSKEVMTYGREDTIKHKLLDDIVECLGDQ